MIGVSLFAFAFLCGDLAGLAAAIMILAMELKP